MHLQQKIKSHRNVQNNQSQSFTMKKISKFTLFHVLLTLAYDNHVVYQRPPKTVVKEESAFFSSDKSGPDHVSGYKGR